MAESDFDQGPRSPEEVARMVLKVGHEVCKANEISRRLGLSLYQRTLVEETFARKLLEEQQDPRDPADPARESVDFLTKRIEKLIEFLKRNQERMVLDVMREQSPGNPDLIVIQARQRAIQKGIPEDRQEEYVNNYIKSLSVPLGSPDGMQTIGENLVSTYLTHQNDEPEQQIQAFDQTIEDAKTILTAITLQKDMNPQPEQTPGSIDLSALDIKPQA